MPTPFFVVLKKKHTVPKFSSHTDTPEAIELQALVKANNKAEYRKKIAEFKNRAVDPKEFRITKGIVYESRPSDEEITVEVALQIKGHSLTWYFWAEGSMDQYSQEFRDGLYFAASKCHKQVTNGCDLYYRGSNSVHIKLMHHDETESNHNHNHYRLLNNKPYTPTEFNQHLDAFKDSDVHDEFFMPGEIDEIREQFATFHAAWTAQNADGVSNEDIYLSEPSQQLNLGDMVELYLFGYQQEPCRINVDELKADYEAARSEIEVSLAAEDPERLRVLLSQMEREYNDILVYRNKGGSRGLGSERASQRQIVGSENPRIKEVVGMDDALDKGLPVIPDWTPTLKLAVQSSLENMFEDAERRRSSARPNRLTTTALVDRSPVKTPCSNRSRATEDLTDIKTPNVSPTKSPQLRRSCSTSDLTQQYTIKSGLKKFLESDEDDLTDDDSASKSSNL